MLALGFINFHFKGIFQLRWHSEILGLERTGEYHQVFEKSCMVPNVLMTL
jgi:hypothetical protein